MTSNPAEDTILIEDLDIECVIGLYAHERDIEQRIVVAAELTVDTSRAALTEELQYTVDYEWVSEQISFILKFGRFQLLETAAHVICQALLLPPVVGECRTAIDAVCLRLRKPAALRGRGLPTLIVRRRAEGTCCRRESTEFGSVDYFYESRHLRCYRANISPNGEFPPMAQGQTEHYNFALSQGLHSKGIHIERCGVRHGLEDPLLRFNNPTHEELSVLCIERARQQPR
jgi:dihydroneopterin aldolase